MNPWTRWVRQPQTLWLRKALFQIHLWTGIAVGLYVLVVSVSGSILVYRVEISRAVNPKPIITSGQGPRLTDQALTDVVARAYPGYQVDRIVRAKNLDQAVEVEFRRARDLRRRLFDPYSGKDLGESVPAGVRFVSWLLDLHDNLIAGDMGRTINGAGAALMTLLALTGMVIWWPGVQKWRRHLKVSRRAGWRRFNWDLHSAVGFWTVLFLLLFGVTGLYLGFPGASSDLVDWLQPPTDTNLGMRVGDDVLYWLARAHFGRFGGWSTKLLWALMGLAPAVLFVTGTLMWWNRVLRRGPRFLD